MAKEKGGGSEQAYATALRRIAACRAQRHPILDLSSLGLSALPPELGELTSLTELNLRYNQLSALPPGLGHLTSLTELYLTDNQLSVLPPELGKLTLLTKLYLSHNQLRALPPELGKLTSLTKLYLGANQLRALPPELGLLTSLTSLTLINNQLSALPPELGLLTSLTSLALTNNQLSALLPELGLLTSLTSLNLSGNRLSALPPELGLLTSLTSLDLSGNQLSALPPELGQLTLLKALYLHDNAALAIPAEVLGPAPDEADDKNPPANPLAILDFYFTRLLEGQEPMREVRLLLVGRGRVGKTSLLKALRGQKPDLREPETPGITVQPLRIACAQGEATAHVWDFGGQEFLHGTHQIFLAERCVYLLVLEGRESHWEAETDYWLRFIQSFGGDSPVIVVLSKFDEHPFSVDRYRLQERCPQIAGFVETDAFTARGIEQLKTLLATAVNGMPDVWLGVPKPWHRVKEALAQTSESFLEYRQYQMLCAQHGVRDEGKQDSLAQTLHRLGIALNFRDHHRLRETSVLKPQWVTEAIYGLLRFVQKKECHGVLELAWLAEALDRVRYPQDKHAFVLELMEKFEVAFALDGARRWLVPEQLREEQPAAFDEFRGAGVRRLRFSYPEALPPGLLPRFIVRTHEMSEAHPASRWRSGVVLEWTGCQALVRLQRSERRTEVAVRGAPQQGCQDLFDLIRAHLTVLHGRVQFVEEVELDGHPGTWVSAKKLRLHEAEGTREIKEETKGALTKIDVSGVLDGVESAEARAAERDSAPSRMRLFISYAHEDAKKVRGLSTHLTILGQRGYIQAWGDKQLIAGDCWQERILEELARADIVLLLYSSASRASEFIQKTEAPRAVERARESGKPCTLIVVPLDRSDWDQTHRLEQDLRTFQSATWNAKPVLKFSPQHDGWLEVEHAIRKAVELRRRPRVAE